MLNFLLTCGEEKMSKSAKELEQDSLTDKIIGFAIEVHRGLGLTALLRGTTAKLTMFRGVTDDQN